MSEGIPTIGGVATTGETFTKLLHHIREAQELCAVMGHLLNTEDNHMDRLLATGWLGMSELFGNVAKKVTQMAMRKLQ